MKKWSLEWLTRECTSGEIRRLPKDELEARFESKLLAPGASVQSVCGAPKSAFAIALVADVVTLSPDTEAWERMHLLWRYWAFKWRVYLDRLFDLVSERRAQGNRGRLSIGAIDSLWFTELLMLTATSSILRETDAENYFAEKCSFLKDGQPPYTTENPCSIGPVATFMYDLVSRRRKIDSAIEFPSTKKHNVFKEVLDSWNLDSFDASVTKLLDLHAHKVRNLIQLDNDLVFGLQDSMNICLPFEVLYIQQIRREQGLSIPGQNHPLLQVPWAKVPETIPVSGFDPYLSRTYELCKKLMPSLSVEWEEKYQQ